MHYLVVNYRSELLKTQICHQCLNTAGALEVQVYAKPLVKLSKWKSKYFVFAVVCINYVNLVFQNCTRVEINHV